MPSIKGIALARSGLRSLAGSEHTGTYPGIMTVQQGLYQELVSAGADELGHVGTTSRESFLQISYGSDIGTKAVNKLP